MVYLSNFVIEANKFFKIAGASKIGGGGGGGGHAGPQGPPHAGTVQVPSSTSAAGSKLVAHESVHPRRFTHALGSQASPQANVSNSAKLLSQQELLYLHRF